MSRAASPRSGDRVAWDPAAVADVVALCRDHGCAYAADEPLARHTSMGVGGTTPLMVWPPRPEAVAEVLSWIARRGLPWRPLGGGTNVLVSDRGMDAAVIHLGRLTDDVRTTMPEITFPAGLPTALALRLAARQGLAGLEWTTGLPGTIGGAAAGNAGCWGGEMADMVSRVDLFEARGGWQSLGADEVTWEYRRADFGHPPESFAIVAVTVRLQPGDPEALEARYRELQQVKRQRQPVGARNAGCIFKNPPGELGAGQLIDSAGCKGMRVGDAQISELHGNFIVNRGGARSEDVERLIAAVAERVEAHHGVRLQEEIRRW